MWRQRHLWARKQRQRCKEHIGIVNSKSLGIAVNFFGVDFTALSKRFSPLGLIVIKDE